MADLTLVALTGKSPSPSFSKALPLLTALSATGGGTVPKEPPRAAGMGSPGGDFTPSPEAGTAAWEVRGGFLSSTASRGAGFGGTRMSLPAPPGSPSPGDTLQPLGDGWVWESGSFPAGGGAWGSTTGTNPALCSPPQGSCSSLSSVLGDRACSASGSGLSLGLERDINPLSPLLLTPVTSRAVPPLSQVGCVLSPQSSADGSPPNPILNLPLASRCCSAPSCPPKPAPLHGAPCHPPGTKDTDFPVPGLLLSREF